MPRAANLRMQEQGGKGVENEEENSGIRQLLGVKVRVAQFISYILSSTSWSAATAHSAERSALTT